MEAKGERRMIDIFITHYAPGGISKTCGLNELLVDEIQWLIDVTGMQYLKDYQVSVVYHATDPESVEHMHARLQPGVATYADDRTTPGTIPSMRNKVLDVARVNGSEHIVLLHNDIRVARGWLAHLRRDLLTIEEAHGHGQALVAPRHIPYHFVAPKKTDAPEFWAGIAQMARVPTRMMMQPWCEQWGFEFDPQRGVASPAWEPPTPDGHQLMMWMARPSFFDDVGECDEAMTGVNYDDADWGMRALLCGKTLYRSKSSLVGHIEGLMSAPRGPAPIEYNRRVFVNKWGPRLTQEFETGRIWPRLRELAARGGLITKVDE